MRYIKLLAINILLLIAIQQVFSQQTEAYQAPGDIYESALELFHKQKYGAAQKQFTKVIDLIEAPSSQMEANAEYYAAICALELFNRDAEEMLNNFIDNHPENSKVRTAYFQLGKFQYRKDRHRQAIRSFEQVDIYDLSHKEKMEYFFKLGYSYFRQDKKEEAKTNFYKIIDKDNEYQDPANYYYGHIAYENKNYETALKSFNKLLDNEIFKPVLPYYITQIYYKQEKYDKLLKVAPRLLENATDKRKPEIARLIGDSYYQTERYAQAVPYLEQYHQSARRSTKRGDHYQLAYAYFKSQKFKKAIKQFDKVTGKKDTMTQNAYYHMGHCYLKTENKKFALNTFLSAYKNQSVEEISQDALFSYAKLAYELSYDPYNEAINAFQKFTREYPNSERVDKANSYLVKLFLSTKNYKQAFEVIQQIENKSTKLKIAYQKITYYRGVELFNNGHIHKAINLFDTSTNYNYDKKLSAKALYWSAEGLYRKGKYDQAIRKYKQFQVTSGAFKLPFYNESSYNIGYAHFKQKEYAAALTAFRKFADNAEKNSDPIYNDALVRTADCYYATKEYREAVKTYNRVIQLQKRDVDYALYQKALARGVMGDFKEKAATLKKLVNDMAQSPYADDATYELANTYLVIDNNQQALLYFNHLINNYPNSSKLVKAMQKKALVYYNTDNFKLALNTFKHIRDKYPGTKESKEALVSIRNIYTNTNRPEEFFKYAKENAIEVSSAEQDSTTYLAAEKIYMDGDCEKSLRSFRKYLNKFPKGVFALNAHYYMADCLYRNGKINKAASHYQLIADTSMTKFKEKSVMRLAHIRYEQDNYNSALKYYQLLGEISDFKNNIIESRKWVMRCHKKLNNHKKAMMTARKLINTEKISNEWENEAHMTVGKAAMAMDSTSTALEAFKFLSKNLSNEMAVEAKYLIAKIEFDSKNLKKAENLLFEIINEAPSYDYWIGKSFILIADIYFKRDNVVQAKATLQSIIDNYEYNPDSNRPNLIEVAKSKKQDIIQKEKEKQKEKSSDKEEMELNYGGDEESGLFNENGEETQDKEEPSGDKSSQDTPESNNENTSDKQ